jgi:hypothetical protein
VRARSTEGVKDAIMDARRELASLRADIRSELGDSPNDAYLKASFLTAVDVIDLNLGRALR